MDSKAENFRAKIYPEYKAQRDRMPDDLRAQESLIFELFAALDVPVIAKEWFEADDIIGTFATRLGKDENNDIYIVSGDKDLYQFVGERVAVYDTMKRIVARRKEALEKFGVPPEHVVDYLAIVGDSSDNIPGITGFWPKKAESLITQFGSLENIYEHADEVTGKAGETLKASREVAFLSKKLATIDTSVSVEWDAEKTRFDVNPGLRPEAIEFFKKLGFKSLIPAHENHVTRFEDLKIEYRDINLSSEVSEFCKRLQSCKELTLATYGPKDTLAGIVLRVDKDTSFVRLRSEAVSLQEIVDTILNLSENTTIIGYDIKSDLRRMESYKRNSSTSALSENLSLF